MGPIESARDSVIGQARLLVASHEQAEAIQNGPQADYLSAVIEERHALKALASALDHLDAVTSDL